MLLLLLGRIVRFPEVSQVSGPQELVATGIGIGMDGFGNAPPAAGSAGGGLREEKDLELNDPAAVLVDGASAPGAVTSHPQASDAAPRPVTAGLLPEEVGGGMPPQPLPPIETTGRAIANIILGEESAAGSTSADPKSLLRNWAPPPPPAEAQAFLPPQPGSRPPPSLGPGPGPEATTSHEPSPLPDVPHIVAPSSYLRQRALNRTAMAAVPEQPPLQPTVFDKEQSQGLVSCRRVSFDATPACFWDCDF